MPHSFKDAAAAYADGKATGLKWDKPYIPGGPHVHHAWHSRNPTFIAFCKESRLQNNEWKRGWQDGVRIRKAAAGIAKARSKKGEKEHPSD